MPDKDLLISYLENLQSQLKGMDSRLDLLTEIMDRLSKTEERTGVLLKQIIRLQEDLDEVQENVDSLEGRIRDLENSRLVEFPFKKALSIILVTALSVAVTLKVTDMYAEVKVPGKQLGDQQYRKEENGHDTISGP